MPAPLLAAWHDFYALIGTAAATLVGLMFVAASVGSGVFTQERQVGLRTFLSPTVVAFSVVVATSLIASLPVAGWRVPGGLLMTIGLLGVIYAGRVGHRMAREGLIASIDTEDRAWYVAVPALAYLLLAVAGLAFGIRPDAGCTILAISTCLLLLAGIRNAWDMTTWVVMRRRE